MSSILLPDVPDDRTLAVRWSRRLVLLTLVWNSVELVVAMAAGLSASSAALIGFALDSGVESAASGVLLWRLARERREGCTLPDDDRAQRLIAWSLAALAVLVALESTRQLVTLDAPDPSTLGIVLASLSLVVMPWLATAKRRLAPALGSRAAEGEAAQTMVCAWLSAGLLVGLLANSLAGWWWADPIVGLGIAGVATWEARRTWQADSLEDTCC
jgi:divalent metal cation (Fe/Co/Zn/Cd) transporter